MSKLKKQGYAWISSVISVGHSASMQCTSGLVEVGLLLEEKERERRKMKWF